MTPPRIARFVKFPFPVLLASVLLGACGTDTTLGSKSIEETEQFTIPGNPIGALVGEVPAFTIPVPIDPASQPGYDPDDFDFITSVKVRNVSFEIAPASNNDSGEDGSLDTFEFVSGLTIGLKASGDSNANAVEIANLPMNDPQIASNATMVIMNVNGDEDIRDLIEAPGGPELVVTISGSIPPDNVIVNANVRFRVGLGFR